MSGPRLQHRLPKSPSGATCLVNGLILYLGIIGMYFASPSSCSPNTRSDLTLDSVVPNIRNITTAFDKRYSSNFTLNVSSLTTPRTIVNHSSEEDYYDYYSDDEASRRIRDNSKIAQVVVFFSVVIIALAGILIKYFVTEYETSQMKAQEQLNYQRLQSVQD